MRKAWIIVGASRGIGLEFVRQLAGSGERIIAAVRSRSSAEQLFAVVAQYKGLITVEECDVASEESIEVSFRHDGPDVLECLAPLTRRL
jgi:NAD(P)-dependent dehydrogenase (short-subunit alcohol dehydrogenase family)